jgi:hypothetical protein
MKDAGAERFLIRMIEGSELTVEPIAGICCIPKVRRQELAGGSTWRSLEVDTAGQRVQDRPCLCLGLWWRRVDWTTIAAVGPEIDSCGVWSSVEVVRSTST